MALLVLKFGGTSVADIDRIRHAARHIKREVDAGHKVAVIVSAMAGTTDQLVNWTKQVSSAPDRREYDAIVSTGEQITAGLLAIILQEMDVVARSWLGWQVAITTNSAHGSARITSVETVALDDFFQTGSAAIIAGFQGVSSESRVTTLGRGGSDTSAVAIAAALKARRCDIYTDVDGVYTTDPRIVSKAQKLTRISYEEMLEMASLGAKVLQTRSVELAMVHGVRLQVRSSFDDPDADQGDGNTMRPGTLVCDEEEIVEQQVVSGIAYSKDEAKVTLTRVADRPGIAAAIFGPLAQSDINVDMIVQNVSDDGRYTDVTFTVPMNDLDRALEVLEACQNEITYEKLSGTSDVVKVSAIGIGMRSHAGVAAKMFQVLAEKSINILAITTSEIKVSILIDAAYSELAIRTLHTAYGLDEV
jgi:aspartate kinase